MIGIGKFIGKPKVVYAHCDIPCGVYDPHGAQIAALSVARMMDMLGEAKGEHDISRITAVKEQQAELCKHEVRIIWGDYFKEEHVKKHPDLHNLVHKIMKLGSGARQGTDREVAAELVEAVNDFAEVFWETKGIKTKRVKSPYKPELEVVQPEL